MRAHGIGARGRLFSMGALAAALTACGSDPGPASGLDDAARSSAASASDAGTPYAAAMQVVDSIAGLRELGKANVETVLDVTLTPAPESFDQGAICGAPLAGPFERIEVRVASPPAVALAATRESRVVLEVRSGVQMPLSEFRAAGRITPNTPLDVNPDVPPEGTLTFRDEQPNRSVRYEFGAVSQELSAAIVVGSSGD